MAVHYSADIAAELRQFKATAWSIGCGVCMKPVGSVYEPSKLRKSLANHVRNCREHRNPQESRDAPSADNKWSKIACNLVRAMEWNLVKCSTGGNANIWWTLVKKDAYDVQAFVCSCGDAFVNRRDAGRHARKTRNACAIADEQKSGFEDLFGKWIEHTDITREFVRVLASRTSMASGASVASAARLAREARAARAASRDGHQCNAMCNHTPAGTTLAATSDGLSHHAFIASVTTTQHNVGASPLPTREPVLDSGRISDTTNTSQNALRPPGVLLPSATTLKYAFDVLNGTSSAEVVPAHVFMNLNTKQVDIDALCVYGERDTVDKARTNYAVCRKFFMRLRQENVQQDVNQAFDAYVTHALKVAYSVDAENEILDNLCIKMLTEAGAVWLEQHAHHEVENVWETIRANILVLGNGPQQGEHNTSDEHGAAATRSASHSNAHHFPVFQMRASVDKLLSELKVFTRVAWRMPELFPDKNEAVKATLETVMQSDQSMEEQIKCLVTSGIVPTMILNALAMKPKSLHDIGLTDVYLLIRAFREPSSLASDMQAQFVSLECAKQRSTAFLSLLRTAMCGYLVRCEHVEQSWQRLSQDIGGNALSTLYTRIARLRNMAFNRNMPETRLVGQSKDIAYERYMFRFEKYSVLGPELVARATRYMKNILPVAHQPKLELWMNTSDRALIIDAPHTDGQHWNVRVLQQNGSIALSSSELRELLLCSDDMRDEYHTNIKLLASVIACMLIGMGGGAVRWEEIFRLQTAKVHWVAHAVEYITKPHKKASAFSPGDGKQVTHRLDVKSSRVVLFWLSIILREHSGINARIRDVFPVALVDTTTKQRELCEKVFTGCFEMQVTAQPLRQFFAGVSNHMQDILARHGELSCGAGSNYFSRLFAHSDETHRREYSSSGHSRLRVAYAMWHTCFGAHDYMTCETNDDQCQPPSQSDKPSLWALELTPGIVNDVLRDLVGDEQARWKCKEQESLVMEVMKDRGTRHVMGFLPCGAGKSMAWCVPLALAKKYGRDLGLCMVLVPHNALVDGHVHEAKHRFQALQSDVLIEGFTRADEATNRFVHQYNENRSLPDLAFISLSVFFTLIGDDPNSNVVKRLVDDNRVWRLFIDEAHLFLQQMTFRADWGCLQGIAGLGVSLGILSASLVRRVRTALALAFGVQNNHVCVEARVRIEDIELKVDILRTLMTLEGKPVESNDQRMFLKVKTLLETGSRVHMICSKVVEARELARRLKENRFDVELCVSETEGQMRADVLGRWARADLQGLVSTTAALVGINAGPRMSTVVFIGLPWSVLDVQQGIGRVRPDNAGKNARILVLVNSASLQEQRVDSDAPQDEAELLAALMRSAGAFEPDEEGRQSAHELAHDLLSQAGVRAWLNEGGCRINNLINRLGGELPHNRCDRCDACTNTHVYRAATHARQEISNSLAQHVTDRELVENNLYNALSQHCIVCMLKPTKYVDPRACAGLCGMLQDDCFVCGMKHKRAQCRAKSVWNATLKDHACGFCFKRRNQHRVTSGDSNENAFMRDHGVNMCAMRDRFKGLLRHYFAHLCRTGKRTAKQENMGHEYGIYLAETFRSDTVFFPEMKNLMTWLETKGYVLRVRLSNSTAGSALPMRKKSRQD